MSPTLDLAYPFSGRWLAQNSPADRVPSHGTHQFASGQAIDFVPVDDRGRTAPLSLTSMLRPEAPDRFPGFGRPIIAPASGVVAAVQDGEPDHDAFRGLPSVRYALTQHRRAAQGWAGLGGNHVVIALQSDAFVALCHLRNGSVRVAVGQSIASGAEVGECGNSGNSTEPHVHVQAMDGLDLQRAHAVPMTFDGALPRNREIIEVPA